MMSVRHRVPSFICRGVLCTCALLVMVSVACVTPALGQEASHPNEALIPGFYDNPAIVSKEARDASSKALRSVRQDANRLTRATVVRTIGKREGAADEMLGQVEAVSVGPDGETTYILDSVFNRIQIYGSSGHLADTFGGPGRGPNEFRRPEGLIVFPDSMIVVLNESATEFKMYRRVGRQLEHARTERHGRLMTSMCGQDTTIVLKGMTPSPDSSGRKMLHLYDRQGKNLASFGQGYQSKHLTLNLQLSSGPVAYGSNGQIVTAMVGTPMIYGFNAEGVRKWAARVEDYNAISAVTEGGRTTFTRDEVSDVTRSLSFLPSGNVVVQVERRTRSSSYEIPSYDTYVLSGETGEGVYVDVELSQIMSLTKDRIYAYSELPYPEVQVLRFPR